MASFTFFIEPEKKDTIEAYILLILQWRYDWNETIITELHPVLVWTPGETRVTYLWWKISGQHAIPDKAHAGTKTGLGLLKKWLNQAKQILECTLSFSQPCGFSISVIPSVSCYNTFTEPKRCSALWIVHVSENNALKQWLHYKSVASGLPGALHRASWHARKVTPHRLVSNSMLSNTPVFQIPF